MSGIKVEVTKQYFVPNSVIEDVIIDMAGYGMTSWASHVSWDKLNRLYTVYYEQEWSLLDDPEGDEDQQETWTVLSYAQIAQAASALAFDPGITVGSTYKGYAAEFFRELEDPKEEFPGGDIDAEVADMIIQIAIFGDVIYG